MRSKSNSPEPAPSTVVPPPPATATAKGVAASGSSTVDDDRQMAVSGGSVPERGYVDQSPGKAQQNTKSSTPRQDKTKHGGVLDLRLVFSSWGFPANRSSNVKMGVLHQEEKGGGDLDSSKASPAGKIRPPAQIREGLEQVRATLLQHII